MNRIMTSYVLMIAAVVWTPCLCGAENQAERCGIMNATHGMQSMNPVAVGKAVHAFLKKHPLVS